MLIVLTQQDTRCNDSPCKTRKEFILLRSVVKAEAEFIQIRLEVGAPAIVGIIQKRLQISNRPMKPLQISIDRIIFLGSAVDAIQTQIALITVTLDLNSIFQKCLREILQDFRL